jgi:hypothetical protein
MVPPRSVRGGMVRMYGTVDMEEGWRRGIGRGCCGVRVGLGLSVSLRGPRGASAEGDAWMDGVLRGR